MFLTVSLSNVCIVTHLGDFALSAMSVGRHVAGDFSIIRINLGIVHFCNKYAETLHSFITQLYVSLGYIFYFMLLFYYVILACPHELVRFRKSSCLGFTCYLFFSPWKWPEMTHFLLKPLVLSPQTWLDTSKHSFFFSSQTRRRIVARSCLKSHVLSPQTWLQMSVFGDKLKHSWKLSRGFNKNNCLNNHEHSWARPDLPIERFFFFAIATNTAGHVLMSPQKYLVFIATDGLSRLQMLKHGQFKCNTIPSTSRYESPVM